MAMNDDESLTSMLRWAQRAALSLGVGALVNLLAQIFVHVRTLPRFRSLGVSEIGLWILLSGALGTRAVILWRVARHDDASPPDPSSVFAGFKRVFQLNALLIAIIFAEVFRLFSLPSWAP